MEEPFFNRNEISGPEVGPIVDKIVHLISATAVCFGAVTVLKSHKTKNYPLNTLAPVFPGGTTISPRM